MYTLCSAVPRPSPWLRGNHHVDVAFFALAATILAVPMANILDNVNVLEVKNWDLIEAVWREAEARLKSLRAVPDRDPQGSGTRGAAAAAASKFSELSDTVGDIPDVRILQIPVGRKMLVSILSSALLAVSAVRHLSYATQRNAIILTKL